MRVRSDKTATLQAATQELRSDPSFKTNAFQFQRLALYCAACESQLYLNLL